MELTVEGLIKFVQAQDPARPLDNTRWTTCAVGDFHQEVTGRIPIWLHSTPARVEYSAYANFVREDLGSPKRNGLKTVFSMSDGPNVSTYGVLQKRLAEWGAAQMQMAEG